MAQPPQLTVQQQTNVAKGSVHPGFVPVHDRRTGRLSYYVPTEASDDSAVIGEGLGPYTTFGAKQDSAGASEEQAFYLGWRISSTTRISATLDLSELEDYSGMHLDSEIQLIHPQDTSQSGIFVKPALCISSSDSVNYQAGVAMHTSRGNLPFYMWDNTVLLPPTLSVESSTPARPSTSLLRAILEPLRAISAGGSMLLSSAHSIWS